MTPQSPDRAFDQRRPCQTRQELRCFPHVAGPAHELLQDDDVRPLAHLTRRRSGASLEAVHVSDWGRGGSSRDGSTQTTTNRGQGRSRSMVENPRTLMEDAPRDWGARRRNSLRGRRGWPLLAESFAETGTTSCRQNRGCNLALRQLAHTGRCAEGRRRIKRVQRLARRLGPNRGRPPR